MNLVFFCCRNHHRHSNFATKIPRQVQVFNICCVRNRCWSKILLPTVVTRWKWSGPVRPGLGTTHVDRVFPAWLFRSTADLAQRFWSLLPDVRSPKDRVGGVSHYAGGRVLSVQEPVAWDFVSQSKINAAKQVIVFQLKANSCFWVEHSLWPDTNLPKNITVWYGDGDRKNCGSSAWWHHFSGSFFFAAVVQTLSSYVIFRFCFAANSGNLKLLLNIFQLRLHREPLSFSRCCFWSDTDDLVENGSKETQHCGI